MNGIIAEAAQGYLGSVYVAECLVRAASHAGAQFIKFQVICEDELAKEGYRDYSIFSKLDMSFEDWLSILNVARTAGIAVIFEVFGLKSFDLALTLDVKHVKIHCSDVDNHQLLREVADRQSHLSKLFIGVGGALDAEISHLIKLFSRVELVLLVGYQAYPTQIGTSGLERIKTLKKCILNSKHCLGFADHTDIALGEAGASVALAAIAAGADYVEKHITLSRESKMEDYETALNPDEFRRFVDHASIFIDAYRASDSIDEFKRALTDLNKYEFIYRENVRRRLFATRKIEAGQVISENDIESLRSNDSQFLSEFCSDLQALESGRIRSTKTIEPGEQLTRSNVSII